MRNAELTFAFPTVLKMDKKGQPYDASETTTEYCLVSGATELSNWAEQRRQEIGAVLVNFNFIQGE